MLENRQQFECEADLLRIHGEAGDFINDALVELLVFCLLVSQLDNLIFIKFNLGDSQLRIVQLGNEVVREVRLRGLIRQALEIKWWHCDFHHAWSLLLSSGSNLGCTSLGSNVLRIDPHALRHFHCFFGLLMRLRQYQLQNSRLLLL